MYTSIYSLYFFGRRVIIYMFALNGHNHEGEIFMAMSMAATHARGKKLNDAIFTANGAAKKAIAEYGIEKVTDATIGSMMDDNGKIACIPAMEKVYRSLPMSDIISYAPISGLPAYLETVIDLVFCDQKPDGYTAAVATAGGTGAIHHAIANYAEKGNAILTGDWYWGTYGVIANEMGCRLETYKLFNDKGGFNLDAFVHKASELLAKQDSLLFIINSPAHNPTGFALSGDEWDGVIAFAKEKADEGKKITIVVDIAYIDYAGEKNEVRSFMRKFGGLSHNILTLFSFSMSKGYTMYGQRTGALVALSACKGVIEEFNQIMKYSSRAAWSNINRGAMTLLTEMSKDKTVYAQFEKERDALYQMIRGRAKVFMDEAEACGLKAVPYKAGFFLSVPTDDPSAVCDKLHDDLIFAVPLKLGVRIAACSVPSAKMHGVAGKVKAAMDAIKA